jgi:putative toxin-antitoxin system antitoxin component (TIGR02293 family)
LPFDNGHPAAKFSAMSSMAILESLYEAPGIERVDRLSRGLPASVFPALAEKLSLTTRALAESLGISDRTLRTRATARRLSSEEATLSFQAFRVFKRAAEVLGDEDTARAWIAHGQRALGERRPLDLLGNPLGVEEVLHVLGAIDEGVYL